MHPSKPLFVTCGYDKMLFLWNSEEKSLVWGKQLEVGKYLNLLHFEGLAITFDD